MTDEMPELLLSIDSHLCGECGGCIAVCAFDALVLDSDGVREVPDNCTSCKLCIITCPPRAIVLRDEIRV